jgi:hypothetical protein
METLRGTYYDIQSFRKRWRLANGVYSKLIHRLVGACYQLADFMGGPWGFRVFCGRYRLAKSIFLVRFVPSAARYRVNTLNSEYRYDDRRKPFSAACYLDGANKGSSLGMAIPAEERLIREQAEILRSRNTALIEEEAYVLARETV